MWIVFFIIKAKGSRISVSCLLRVLHTSPWAGIRTIARQTLLNSRWGWEPHPLKPVFCHIPSYSLSQHMIRYSTGVGSTFSPAQTHSHSVPKKHIEVYINYELVGLLAQASYELLHPTLAHVSHVAWYLLSARCSHLASSVSKWWLQTAFPLSRILLVAPPILLAWLLASQHFIKVI